MQAMLMAFITINMSNSAKANSISRTLPTIIYNQNTLRRADS